MRTENLINALVADAKSADPPIARTVTIAVAVGAGIALAVFLAVIGVRPDFTDAAASSLRFIFKFVVTLSLAVPAFLLVRALSRPDFKPDARLFWLALAPALLLAGIVAEMSVVPAAEWRARMGGHNSMYCMMLIPLLAAAPFTAIFYALRSGAPANPSLAGAVAGLLAGGIGATLYASHCADDSPLFVATWYPIGIVIMAVLGALLGARYLRW